jgi:hypothetical protein
MKTVFDTPEDIALLERFLSLAVIHTERIFDPAYSQLAAMEYRDAMIHWRAKLYEWLECEDPNLAAIEWIKAQVLKGDGECSSPPLIKKA